MQYTIVHSRYADTLADRVLTNVLKYRNRGYKECSYLERGSDERQYCFPGVDIPLCTFSRTKFYDYPAYHTSGDNLSLICYRINCLCEPQLGRRGLYPAVSKKGVYDEVRKLQDFILYADGRNDLIDISNLIEYPAAMLIDMVQTLMKQGLLDEFAK